LISEGVRFDYPPGRWLHWIMCGWTRFLQPSARKVSQIRKWKFHYMLITDHYVTSLHAWTQYEKLKSNHVTMTEHHASSLIQPLKFTRTSAFNPSKPSGHYMYHQVKHSAILRSAHTVYLCVLCGSQNKQRLVPLTA